MCADIHDGQGLNAPSKGRIQMSKTNHLQIVTSGLHRTAGPYICAKSDQSASQHNSALFDHLGGGKDRLRHSNTKGLGGFEIYNRFIFRRCLHRKIGGFLAFEDTINIASRARELVPEFGSIGDQATSVHKDTSKVN